MYICICMYIYRQCVYIYTDCICMYIHVWRYTQTDRYAFNPICIYDIYVFVHIYTYIYICVYLFLFVYTYIYIFILYIYTSVLTKPSSGPAPWVAGSPAERPPRCTDRTCSASVHRQTAVKFQAPFKGAFKGLIQLWPAWPRSFFRNSCWLPRQH